MALITTSGKGRRWLTGGHPWLYVDDVAGGVAQPGELVPVEDPSGAPLGWGLFSSSSRIAVRMVSREAEQPKRELWAGRVQRAVDARESMGLLDPEGACRLLSGDAEGLPGLVVDRYARTLVLQCGTQSADRMRDFAVELLRDALPFEPDTIVDRSDTSVRKLESLEKRVEVLSGSVDGPITVREGDVVYEVDVLGGHKTGAYLDQRENRIQAARRARGERVLDAFSYDGLFAVHAALGGAESVLCLEQNKAACERIARHAELNGVADRITVERTDAMGALRAHGEQDAPYGLVVVDPPAFARNKRELEGAERGYVELNRRAAGMVRPGGTVVSASCSYNVRPEQFVKFLGRAAHLAGRDLWLDELRGASPDHPWLITLPETSYLKCAFQRAG